MCGRLQPHVRACPDAGGCDEPPAHECESNLCGREQAQRFDSAIDARVYDRTPQSWFASQQRHRCLRSSQPCARDQHTEFFSGAEHGWPHHCPHKGLALFVTPLHRITAKIDEFTREDLYKRVGFCNVWRKSKQISKNCSVYDTTRVVSHAARSSGVARWRHHWKCVTLRMAPLR